MWKVKNEMPSGSGTFGNGSAGPPAAASTSFRLPTRKRAYLNTIRMARFSAIAAVTSLRRRGPSAAPIMRPS